MNLRFFSLIRQCVDALYQAANRCLRQWTRPDNHTLFPNVAADLTRSKAELVLENAFLRQQLITLQRQVKHPTLTPRDRVLLVLLARKLPSWKQALRIVQPDTLPRWHRDLFRWFWKRKSRSRRSGGRPPLSQETVALIKQMAQENHSWGAERIRGEMLKLGIRASTNAIRKYLKQVRPSGSSKQNWGTFLRNHASQIWACDFLQTYDAFPHSVRVRHHRVGLAPRGPFRHHQAPNGSVDSSATAQCHTIWGRTMSLDPRQRPQIRPIVRPSRCRY
jgi:hypothetical protein